MSANYEIEAIIMQRNAAQNEAAALYAKLRAAQDRIAAIEKEQDDKQDDNKEVEAYDTAST